MNSFIKEVIEETFRSKKQQRLFFAKGEKSKKWNKMAHEFADKTDFSKLPEKAEEEQKLSDEVHNGEVDEIVDADGNIQTGDEPGNPNAYIRSKNTTDQVAKSTMGQMGSFGVLGGATGANKTLKYWAESDQSGALGSEVLDDPNIDFDDAKKHFVKDLEVPEDEAEERIEKMGYINPKKEGEVPDGKMRLIENPLKYIEEYLTKKHQNNELVKKAEVEKYKKSINPIVSKQLKSIKQTLKNNDLTVSDIIEYLEDNE